MTTGFVALLLTAMVLLFVVVPLWLGRQVGVRSDGGYISVRKNKREVVTFDNIEPIKELIRERAHRAVN